MPATVPKNVHESIHFNMIHAHNAFKKGYDSIVSRLEDPPKGDLMNFLGYCDAWAQTISHHHHTEEAVLFPFLNRKLDFDDELEQHKVIHAALDELIPLIRFSKEDPSLFDAVKMNMIMSHLREPLFQHLDEEIIHLEPQNLQVFEASELELMLKEMFEYGTKQVDMSVTLPFMLSHTAPEYKGIWPEMPWFVRRVMGPYVFGLRHYGYWKYSPYYC